MESSRIGVALSGGGVRAAVFHLGLLARLAHDDLLKNVAFLSTVSGGSMVTALVYALSGLRWPSSQEYLRGVLPEARTLLTTKSIQRNVYARTARQPWLLGRERARVVSASMQELWGITGLIRDIPPHPRWMINATTYETGKS